MKRWFALYVLLIVSVALFSLQGDALLTHGQSDLITPIFVDVSRSAGIVNNRVAGIDMTSGQAWGDYDNDGWVDLYVTDSGGPNTLYQNNGDGTFSVSSVNSQVALPKAYSNGAIFADYDNDGWEDLFVANWGEDQLFHNEEGQGFVDVTQTAGIFDMENSKTASWGDFNKDSFLDLYIANWSCYPKCGRQMDGETDHLYMNNGDGTFTNVSDYLGGSLNGAGFVASFTDYDNDDDLDIYLVNDEFINPIGNKLWRNDGPGCSGWCFKEVSTQAGANEKLFGMGLAVGDYDNDGDVDFYFSNVGPMVLLQNQGDGTFRDVALEAGVQNPESIGWGSVFFDYDNDGWSDLYLAVADTTNHKDIAANRLFRNNTDGTFTLVDCGNEAADVRMSLGVATADYDQDGWVDLLVGNSDEGYRLYRNQVAEGSLNHWLALEFTGSYPIDRDAVGTRVYLTTPDGVTQMQELINGSSMGSGNELVLYFGLGQAKQADIKVRWLDGTVQDFQVVDADTRYHLNYLGQLEVLKKVGESKQTEESATVKSTSHEIIFGLLGIIFLILGVIAVLSERSGKNNQRFGKKTRTFMLIGSFILGALFMIIAFFPLLSSSQIFSWVPGSIDRRLDVLMAQTGVTPPTNPSTPSEAMVKLGEALFWDPELSGNRDIACATCHHPLKATGDNLSVSIGTGGEGLGEERIKPEAERDFIPRNAPPVFNLGYLEWTVMFWDGRLSSSDDGFNSPASDRLPSGLDNLLAAQAMFPVTSRDEMRGLRGDVDIFGQKNELAMVPDYTSKPIWNGLMKRLIAIPGYVELFTAVYPDIPLDQLGFQHAANALAAYQAITFTFEDSPFDRYIRGEKSALSSEAKLGAELFYGKAGCASCHSGGLLTDQKFYNLAVPQIGPGKGREQPFDLGRARETGNDCDRYAFRTPPLRNVALTGPWMHNGAITSLEEVIRHHLQPVKNLTRYDEEQLTEDLQGTCQDQPEVIKSILTSKSYSASEGVNLSEEEISSLLAFLDTLTSPSALDMSTTIPLSVPSGLPVGGNIY